MIKSRMTLQEAMVYASETGHKSTVPERYYWASVWWRLDSKRSANPVDALTASRNQLALYRDMIRRPEHYNSVMRGSETDWEWSQK